ncbi:MAG: hypothetical protein DHS20C20_20890 [Ardenticatenaceae bacterium]|nr:MAG: hypothetical protein DHS20C20_20890 [Ardenticatenaceae bacterium]
MKYTTRPYQSWQDLQAIADLAYVSGPNFLHVIDLPYRLASWTVDKPKNFRFWYDTANKLVAVAILQEAFLALEYMIHPAADRSILEPEIVRWGWLRGQEVANEQATTFPINVWLRDDQPQLDRIKLLEVSGLALSSRQMVTLECDLSELNLSKEMPRLSAGFQIRPLRGQSEVAAYVALHQAAFASTVMQEGWRMRTLQMPQYRPELDLVVLAPDGRLAAFCVGWLHPHQPLARIEPMGVHPDFHRLGLGRAILTTLFQRLQARNVQFVSLHTTADNEPAIKLYEAVGFHKQFTMLGYRHLFYPIT